MSTLLTKERVIQDNISLDQIQMVAHWNIEMAKEASADKNKRDAVRLMDQGKHLERLHAELSDLQLSESVGF